MVESLRRQFSPTVTKIMPLSEAVGRFVKDGQTVALEGFTHLIPFAAGHEIIRQGRKRPHARAHDPRHHLRPDDRHGLREKAHFSWGGNPGVGSLHRLRDAVENGWPHPLALRGAQPRRTWRARYAGGRLGAALRGAARLRRHRPAEAQPQIRSIDVPLHGRDARGDAGAQPRRHDHPRAESATAKATC